MNLKLFFNILKTIYLTTLISCGQHSNTTNETSNTSPANSADNNNPLVIKSRSALIISTNNQSFPITSAYQLTANQPIIVTNSPSSNLNINNSHFSIPVITSNLLDFGYLEIIGLSDNNLRECGPNRNQKCTYAMIRAYTTGTPGAGLYNTTDEYGAPIIMGQSPSAAVGLESNNAINLQKISIPNNKNVIRLSDFTNTVYPVLSDFSNAGSGNYSTTLVIEYALSL